MGHGNGAQVVRAALLVLVLLTTSAASGRQNKAKSTEPAQAVPFCAFVAALATTNPGDSSLAPVIERVTPMIGHAGDVVTITGRRLTGAVAIFRELAGRTLTATDTEMTVRVPPSTTGPIVVRSPDGQTRTHDAFVYVLKVENDVLFPVPVGGGEWFPASLFRDLGPLANVDDNAKFLQRHWVQPLPPQGDPPESFSILESNTSPRTCQSCHPVQYDFWKDSLHASSASQLVRWNARERGSAYEPTMRVLLGKLKRDDLPAEQRVLARKQLDLLGKAKTLDENSCRRCHDPVAENGPWTEVELSRAPEDPQKRPTRDGVQCVVCHVRAHQKFGPPPRPGLPRPAPPADGEPQPPPAHNGFTASRAYEDSRFCAGCHTFTIRVDKGIVGNPFEEWRVSPFAAQGVSCQQCHMPDRKHLFRGIHDREMTLSGLTISLKLQEDGGLVRATAIVKSTRVGHMFPTYSIPRVHVRLYRSAPLVTTKLPEGGLLLDEYAIGREVDLSQAVEKWDHRIAPGGALVMTRNFPPQAGENVTLHIDVVPRDDYEGPLRERLAREKKDPTGKFAEKVRELLAHEEGLRYRLIEITLPVPKSGASTEKTMREGKWL